MPEPTSPAPVVQAAAQALAKFYDGPDHELTWRSFIGEAEAMVPAVVAALAEQSGEASQ